MIKEEIRPPKPKKIAKELSIHGDTRIDNYFWLNERENPEVVKYLEEENSYNDRMMAHTKQFQENLFEEMKSRIKEDDSSVPYKSNGYWYYVRYEVGKGYPIYARKKETLEAKEEILFNCNEMAEGHSYFKLSGISVSPDNRLVSFGIDTVSRRKYTIQIKNLETGEILPTKIETTTGGSTWANDNKTLFYTRKDEETLRSDKVYQHILGENPDDDILVYHEEDETFNTYVYKSKSKQYIIIGSSSTMSDEYRILDADKPRGQFQLFQERVRGVEYGFSHFEDRFYIITNKDGAQNFKLMKTSVDKTTSEHWEEVIPHREEVLLEDMDIFKNYLVLSERYNGLNRIRIMSWDYTWLYIN